MAESHTHESVIDLIEAGILQFAKEPPKNAFDLTGAGNYTIPLIAQDYPAKTAAMWDAAYAALGMPDRNAMCLAHPEDIGLIVGVFRADPRYRGGGAGIGFKEIILPHLDTVEPLARAMGAVNIVRKFPDGRLAGTNTDGPGYADALEEKFRARGRGLHGQEILILGAGGSAKAVAFALAERGARIIVLNRTPEKAHALATRLKAHFGGGIAESGDRSKIIAVLPRCDAVVSAIDDPVSPLDEYSSLGTMPDPVTSNSIRQNLVEAGGLLERHVKRSLIVSDIRIRKHKTAMLKQARELGFGTLDGVPMVINQGVAAFWWIYGQELAPQGHTKEEVAAIMQSAATMQ